MALSWELGFAIIPGLILFLYGIEHFSREIQRVAGERFRSLLGKLTANPVSGAFLGAATTSIVQSSTAVTVITIGLVNAGTISFVQSAGIIIGANVGTTVTSQLVALNLTGFAPLFILLGFVTGLVGGKYRFLGKPMFYFGLVFFSLNLISDAVAPVSDDPLLREALLRLSDPILAMCAGFLLTNVFQSSSVFTGLVVLLSLQGLISLEQGIPLIIGANVGTTTTAVIASQRGDLFAKRAAAAHLLFNLGGALIFLPMLGPFGGFVASFGGSSAQQIANAHTLFNLANALIFLAILGPFISFIERLVPGKEEEILFRPAYLGNGLPQSNDEAFELIQKELRHSLDIVRKMFDLCIPCLVGGRGDGFDRVLKFESLSDFLDDRIGKALFELAKRDLTPSQAKKVVLLIRMSNAIEQLGDVAGSVAYLTRDLHDSGSRLSQPASKKLEAVYGLFMDNYDSLGSIPFIAEDKVQRMRSKDIQMIELVSEGYEDHMRRLARGTAYSGSIFAEAVSLIESANSRLREIRKLCERYSA
ncbi:MAG: Na/Pi cotransporter family protein [Candidatus Micrarchaeota archaeon]